MFILGPQDEDEDEDEPKSVGSERASVSDASGYYAGLNTREDFGCVEWQSEADA